MGGPQQNPAQLLLAGRVMNEKGIVRSGDALTLGIGAMSDARWERFYQTLVAAVVNPPGLDIKRAYSLEFVNQRVGV